jgi:alcohol dehydrogenase, propanol-preferring
MKAAVFSSERTGSGSFLELEDVLRPQLEAGHVLLRVIACGVCRTDLHIVERDLPPLRPRLIPGHQIVGEILEGATAELPLGTRLAFPGWAASMAIAGTAGTGWKICVIVLPLLDIR